MKVFLKRLFIIIAVLALAIVSIIANFLQRNNTQQLGKSTVASVDEKLPYVEENMQTNDTVLETDNQTASSPTEINNPPIVSFGQMGGELLKGTDKVTFTITDPDGDNILYIKYHWDYYVNNKAAKVRECDGTASTVSARISPPQTNGIHLLRIAGVDVKGAQSPWYIIPYYVVDSYSAVKDSTAPVFDWSKPDELPRNLANIELNQEITIRAKDDESGLYYIAYSWARENETPVYTIVNQPIDGKVTTTAPNETGKWYLRIFAANSTYNNEGKYFEATKTYRYEYNVEDRIAPVATINENAEGNVDFDVALNGTFDDPGATVTDNYDETKTIYAYNTDELNLNKVGTYTLKYKTTDSSGNESNEVSRNVTVVGDRETYELVVPTKKTYRYGEALDITGAKIIVTSKRGVISEVPATADMFTNFTTNTLYANIATFTYNDATAYYKYYVEDYLVRIDLTNPNKVIYEYGEALDLTGAKVQKIMASGATTLVKTVTLDMLQNEFNPTELGTQMLEVEYDGNIIYIVVQVVDTTKPTITLNGEAEIDVLLGESYVDAGATASDEVSGNVEVIPSGAVDTSTIGDYTITYTAVDGNNNIATATRTIYVREDALNMLSSLVITGTDVIYEPDTVQNVSITLPEGAGDAVITYYKDGIKVDNPIEVGTYDVKLATSRGTRYSALAETKVAELVINPIPADRLTVTINPEEFVYDGTEKIPTITVKMGDTTLVKDTDYTIDIENNINVGTATITVTGINKYSDEITKNFEITKRDLYVTAENRERKYGEANPELTYTYSGNVEGETPAFTGALTTEATLNSSVASYDILQGSLELADNGSFIANNYKIDYSKAILSVTTNEIIVTAQNKSKLYGQENPDLTYTFSNGQNGEIPAFTGEIVTEARTLSNAGEYDILQGTLRLVDNGDFIASNYTLEFNKATLTINKKDLTVKAKDASKVYDGTPLTSAEADITDGAILDGETITLVTQGSITNVGSTENELVSVTIASTLGDTTQNYNITKVNGILTITSREINVTAVNDSKVYDGEALTNANVEITGTLASGDEMITTVTGSITDVGSITNTLESVEIINASNENVTANYDITTANGELTILPKEITVTADDKTKVYGEANPELTYTYTPAVEGETVKFEGDIETNATVTSIAGEYNVTQGNLALVDNGAFKASNYTLNFVDATLTITTREITVKSADADKEYDGTALTSNQANITEGSLATGDSISVTVTGTITDVGNIANTIETITILNATNEDVTSSYNITKQEGTLTITSKEITITAENKTKVYGEDNPGLTYTVTAGILGQVPALSGTLTTTATKTSDVGTYPITQGTLTLIDNGDFKASNYSVTFVPGTLEITSRTMTISAANKTKIYGDDIPALTYMYSGVAQGEMPKFEGTLATTATKTSNVGTYPITQGTLTLVDNGDFKALNYTVVFEDAILTVTQREITVTAENKTKTYGEVNPELTYTYANNVDSEIPAFTGSLATNATVASTVGEYNITVGTLALANSDSFNAENYIMNFVDGILTVTQREITIKSADADKEYDGTALTNNQVSVTEGSLATGDSISAVVIGTITDVGNTENTIETVTIINALGDVTSSYNITKQAGTLTITSKEITVTANNKTRKYKAEDPEFGYEYVAGIVGQTPAFTGTLATTATVDSSVGTYPITQGTLALADNGDFKASNYTINFVNGILTITKADYNMSGVVFEDKTFTYDKSVKRVEVDAETLPEGVIVESYDNNDKTDAGTYVVTANFGVTDTLNYEVPESMTATLKINKASYDMSGVIFENKTVSYDGTAKTIEATNLPEGVIITGYVGNENRIDVGVYTITVNFGVTDETNYNIPASMNAILTIIKATYDMTGVVFEDAEYTFDGTAKRVEVDTTTLPEGVTVSSYNNNDKVNAGTYTVTANFSVADTTNYEIPASITATLKINKATINMAGVEFADGTYTYDGTAKRVEVDAETLPSGVFVVNYVNNDKINAGTYTVTANFGVVDTINYEVPVSMTATLTINRASYDITGIEFLDGTFTYDGTAKNIEVTANTIPDGVIVTSYDGNGKVNVGEYIVTANFGVTDALNYEVPVSITATLTINARDITVKAKDASKQYDGIALTKNQVEVVSGSLVAGDAITANVSGTITNVGSTENTIQTITISNASGDVTANYNITKQVGTLTITKSTPALSIVIDKGTVISIDEETATVIPTLTGDGEKTGTISYEMEAGDIASIDSTTGIITLNKTTNSNITVTATYSGDDNTNSITATTEFKIVDITKPVITLLGDNPTVVQVGTSYVEVGATATDNYEGDITSRIVINNSTVNTSVPGTYTVTYNVSDLSENAAEEVTRTVKVVDGEKPLISLVGDNPLDVEYNSTFVDPGATAYDGYDGDITDKIIATGIVDTTTLGTYTIRYNVTDISGNAAEEVTRTVNVVDTTKPVITLDENNIYEIEVYGEIPEFNARATDNYDSTVTVNVTHNINANVVGTYTVTFTATDTNSNTQIVEKEFNVVDTTKPVITLDENNVYSMEVKGTKPTFVATATDNYDTSVTVEITDDIDVNVVGTYTVTFTATDSNNNTETIEKEFNVVDTTKPVITLNSTTPITLEVKSAYVDAGATAYDNYDGDITANIIMTHNIDVNTIGSYTVRYNVTDSNGNRADEVTRTVNVVDTTKPVITLVGADTIEIQAGAVYEDEGATAVDNYDGDITSRIITENPVDTSTLGTYTVRYNVSDTSGNPADEVTRTVTVIDTQKPVITLIGDAEISVEVKTAYVDEGATAVDNYDGDITSSIITTSTVNMDVLGTYTVKYNVEDAQGNPADEVTRTVHVVDTTKPVITLNGETSVTIEVGSTYADAGATAVDNYDGDITSDIVTVNPVDSSRIGTYTVTYNVKDANNNIADQVTRTVNVVDTTLPVITLDSNNIYTMEVKGIVPEFNATATDNYDSNVTVSITHNIDKNTVGTYIVTFTAVDSSNNTATIEKQFTVVDTQKPVITLNGVTPVTIEVGTTYVDAGVTITDNYDTNLVPTVVSTVDTTTPGEYTVTYNVTDSNENAADEVIRTVIVRDTTAPVITLNGTTPVTIEVGTTYVDAGVTVTDNYDTEIASRLVTTNNVNSSVVGEYTVVYNVTDVSGNPAFTKTRIVKVVDTTKPVITLIGDATIALRVGDDYTDAGATAFDSYDGDITANIVTVNPVNTAVVGTYTITYNVKDTNNNSADEVIRTVHVVDDEKPTITLSPNNVYEMEVNTVKPVFVATAYDNYDGEIRVTITDNINTAKVGTYTITFTATDSEQNSEIIEKTFRVLDTTAPVIRLNGDSVITIEVGSTYADEGATVTDNYDTNVVLDITGRADTEVVGTYTITFNAQDSNGNVAQAVTRTVNVVDTTCPTISLPVEIQNFEAGANYSRLLPIVSDNYDSESYLLNSVSVSDIDMRKVGTQVVTYTVSDSSGNTAEATVAVVIEDTTAPTIQFADANVANQRYTVGGTYTAPEFITTDNSNGEITIKRDGIVDSETPGTYTVKYMAVDESGNKSEELTVVVKVLNYAPAITYKNTILYTNITDGKQFTGSVTIYFAGIGTIVNSTTGQTINNVTAENGYTLTEAGEYEVTATLEDGASSTVRFTLN